MGVILEVKDISISFAGIKAVQHLSFSIEQGEILGLIGPNGSGKSTTVNMIAGNYIQDEGEVVFDGQPVSKKLSIAKRSHLGMGRTFQTPRPFGNLSVYDNVFAIFLQKYHFKEADLKAREILELSRLAPLSDLAASQLSIEKRKWLDLARVLATEPKFVMMDEVMAGLNPNEMLSSLDFVQEINKRGITILFIEHVMQAVVSVCTRAIVLNEGRFLYEGTPREVLENPSVIEAYIGRKKDAKN
ncbi:MAG: ABC transporter ATP-binding protein [Treponema sp.]|jgi:ABC-type branched-subunit amino acid transport system ATPase component|nr:ABC transporter ATP-binding protein [Treponema sp.]